MRILFVTTKTPLPANDGHSIRTFNILKQLSKEHEIHLLSFVKYPEEYDYLNELQKKCKSVRLFNVPENMSKTAIMLTLVKSMLARVPYVVDKYNREEMRMAIQHVLSSQKIDLLHLDMLPLGSYIHESDGIKTLLNEHNVESMLLKRRMQQEKNPITKYFIKKQQAWLEGFEHSIIQKVTHILACSHEDKNILETFKDCQPVTVIPNGVDVEYFYPADPRKKRNDRIIFVGGVNWPPNKDAMIWFDREIFPKILAIKPDVKLYVIGRGGKISWKNQNNIIQLGFVQDVRPFMEESAVFVVPLRIGGGTRLKILNAMAMRGSVVSTTIGAEGLDVTDGENILLADDPLLFADHVVTLLDSQTYNYRIGSKARELIKEVYDWNIIGKQLRNLYEEILSS